MSRWTDDREKIDPRIRQRRDQVERSRTQKRLLWLAGFVAACALIAMSIFLLHTPWFGAKVVTVVGSHPNTSDLAIESAAGLLHHPPLISVDPGTTAVKVESLPFIASVHVTRHWPDAVTLTVTERKPVVTMSGPASAWSTLDGAGRTLAITPARPGLPSLAVQVHSGMVPPGRVGVTVAPAAEPGLRVARTLPLAFAGQVTSITVAVDGTVTLALHSGLVVLLGTGSNLRAKYEDIAAIIANAPLHGAHTIDVTVPQSPTVAP